jgi:hypothetical protein
VQYLDVSDNFFSNVSVLHVTVIYTGQILKIELIFLFLIDLLLVLILIYRDGFRDRGL